MKIGILTLPLHTNYGGILQAWALQTVLERMGHYVEVLGKEKEKRPSYLIPLIYLKRILLKLIGRFPYPINYEKYSNIRYNVRNEIINTFKTQRIKEHIIDKLEHLSKCKYDLIIVGSDQIWRKRYVKENWKTNKIEHAFLCHIPTIIPRIAYAASFGIDDWKFTPDETQTIKIALNYFKAISVRENSAKNLLKSRLHIDSVTVLDPTMLLKKEDYIKEFNLKNRHEHYIATYILDVKQNITEFLNEVSISKNFPLKDLMSRDDKKKMGVEDWIENIMNAKLIITDSFHGCVFSLIFRKPVLVIRNFERGNTRFDTLIDTFGLQSNVIRTLEEYNPNNQYNLPEDINDKVTTLTHKSIKFLNDSLRCS